MGKSVLKKENTKPTVWGCSHWQNRKHVLTKCLKQGPRPNKQDRVWKSFWETHTSHLFATQCLGLFQLQGLLFYVHQLVVKKMSGVWALFLRTRTCWSKLVSTQKDFFGLFWCLVYNLMGDLTWIGRRGLCMSKTGWKWPTRTLSIFWWSMIKPFEISLLSLSEAIISLTQNREKCTNH